jgi:microcompartment protein CcmL/EutN
VRFAGDSLGLLECDSIAAGVRATDEILKTARVEVVEACPVSPGKFLVVFTGGVAEVESSLDAGREAATGFVIDELLLARVHPDVAPALTPPDAPPEVGRSLAVVETTSVAAAIVGADAAAKAAWVRLLEIAPGRGIGGKGFFTMTGDVAAVQAGADAARILIDRRGAHVRTEILAGPHPELARRVGRRLLRTFGASAEAAGSGDTSGGEAGP